MLFETFNKDGVYLPTLRRITVNTDRLQTKAEFTTP